MSKAEKVLLLRLSSLGDVILACSALEVEALPPQVDWAVSREYSVLLKGHPRIRNVLEYDRSTGFIGWIKFSVRVWESGYLEIIDLHKSLRTRLMRFLFFVWGVSLRQPRPQWRVVSKQKWRLYGYYVLKRFWPKIFFPEPWVDRYSKRVGGSGEERPRLNHLLEHESFPSELAEALKDRKNFICVMPSSRWNGKKWPVQNYVALLKQLPEYPVIFGTLDDVESVQLAQYLQDQSIPHFSGVGRWDLRQTAKVLSVSSGYLGADTGLAHLAEAVGVPVKIIFGPTTPQMGFGPWRTQSQSIGLSLGCRPCSKDGESCYRFTQRHQCLKGLTSPDVLQQINDLFQKR